MNIRSGSHITSNAPVYDSTGKVIAVVGVQKSIQEYVNNHLCYGNTTGTFVTCWLGIIDLKTRKLSFVNAGHSKYDSPSISGIYKITDR